MLEQILKFDNFIFKFFLFRKNKILHIKVTCVISSETKQTDLLELNDPKRKLFNRGGIDSFILIPKGYYLFCFIIIFPF